MRIVGMATIGEGEGDRWLAKVLKRNLEICDKLILWGDNPDQKTIDVCQSFDRVDYYHCKEKLWGVKQNIICQQLLGYVLKENPDWIIGFAADEIFEKRFDRKKAEELAQKDEISYLFYIIQLYDNENQMRIGHGWGGFWNVRYYKNCCKDFGTHFFKKPIHPGIAPQWAYRYGTESGLLVKHYGYMKAEDRKKKIERYEKFDPNHQHQAPDWYNSMKEEPELRKFSEERVAQDIHYKPKWSKITNKNIVVKNMKCFYVKNKHGIVVTVPEKILQEVLKDGTKELLGTVERNPQKIPAVKLSKYVCPICGWEKAKNAKSLRMHKLRAHKVKD